LAALYKLFPLLNCKDLIHWDKRRIDAARPLRPLEIKTHPEEPGKLYSLYGGSSLGIDLAISDDGIAWKPSLKNPVIPFPPEMHKSITRLSDPHTFYYPEDGLYRVTMTARLRDRPDGAAGLVYGATSSDMLNWSAPKPIYDPGNINEPECPERFQAEDHVYLVAGWAPNKVGQARYRVADRPDGPWRIPEIDSLGSTEFKVPNSATDGNRRLFFGWLPTYANRRDHQRSEWGGHLAFPRELVFGERGVLYLRAPEELKRLRGNSLSLTPMHRMHGKAALSPAGIRTYPGGDYVEVLLPGGSTYYEIEATFTLGTDCPAAGMIIHAGDEQFPGYEVVIDATHQFLLLRTRHEMDRNLASTEIALSSGEAAHLRLFVDGDIVEAFLNDRFSLVGRIHRMPTNPRAGFYVQRGEAAIQDIARHELQFLFPAQPAASNRIEPDFATLKSSPGSALFPIMSAHVYTPFGPELNFQESFTLECRTLVTPGAEDRKANLIVKGDAEWGYHYGLNLMPGNAVEIYFRSSAHFVALTSEPNSLPAPGVWSHIVGVVDRENRSLSLYVDGRQVGSCGFDNEPLDPENQGVLRLGRAVTIRNSDQFFGLLDDVRLWSRALSLKEIRDIAESQPVGAEIQDLVLWWDFNQPCVRIDNDTNRVYFRNLVESKRDFQAGFYSGAQATAVNCR